MLVGAWGKLVVARVQSSAGVGNGDVPCTWPAVQDKGGRKAVDLLCSGRDTGESGKPGWASVAAGHGWGAGFILGPFG